MPLEFLDGQAPDPVETPVLDAHHEPIIETPPEEPKGPLRGPDGKFASPAQNEPEPPAPPEPAPAVVAPPAPQEPGHVPLSVVLDEREKRQAAEARLRYFEQQEALRQQQQATPDPYEDWQGYLNVQQQQQQSAIVTAKLQMSQTFAIDKFGEETVQAADAWSDQMEARQPGFKQGLVGQAHPYGTLVQMFQRDQALGKLGNGSEVDQFLAWKAAQAQAQANPVPAPASAAASPPQSTPPRSLASLPSAGNSKPGETPVGPGVAFEQAIRR